MLNRQELINYRLLRGVSQNEVAKNSDISQTLVALMESGEKSITENNHREYVRGVNRAYELKKVQKNTLEKVVKVEEPKDLSPQKVVKKKNTKPKNNKDE